MAEVQQAPTPQQDYGISGLQDQLAQEQAALGQHSAQREAQNRAQIESGMSEIERLGTERHALAGQMPSPNLPTLDQSQLQLDSKKTNMVMMGLMAMAMTVGRGKSNWLNTQAAMNGFLEGHIKGNQERANTYYEKFKTEYKRASDEYSAQLDRYKSILEDKDKSLNEKMTLVKMIAAENEHPDAYELASKGRIAELEKQVEARMRMQEKHDSDVMHWQEHRDNVQLKAEIAAQAHQDRQAALALREKVAAGEPISDDEVDTLVQYVKSGGKLSDFVKARGTAGQNVSNRVLQRLAKDGFLGSDIAKAGIELKATQSALSQVEKQRAMVKGFDETARKNADLALKAALKGSGGTQYPILNRAIINGKINSGDPDVVAFRAALKTFQAEYAKVMQGATGAAGLTDAATKEADVLINEGYTVEQLKADIDMMKQDMANRISSQDDIIQELHSSIGPTPSAAPAAGQVKFLGFE